MYELRQKQYSAFSNEISDSTKNYGYTCSWQMRELKSKDISFLKSGCLFVAHILAELHISYISFTISSQPLSPTDEKRKRFSSHRIFKPTAIRYFINVQMNYLDNFDLVDRTVISLYSALRRCLKMFSSTVVTCHVARF